METQAQLRTKLKVSFFDLMSEIQQNSYAHLWTVMMEKIKVILHARFAAFYLFEPSLQIYQLKSRLGDEITFLRESYMDADLQHIKPLKDVRAQLIRLEPAHEEKGFIYIAFDEEYDSETLQMIKKETENFMQLISQFAAKHMEKNHQTILADLASHLLSFTRKEDILYEVTKLLTDLYPVYTLDLLLSQDMEQGLNQYFKTLEYSEDMRKESGVQAFISGEVRSEKDEKGNIVCLYAPLKGNQGVYGVFKVGHKNLPETEIEFLSKIAHTTGKAMEKAILYENSIGHAADLNLINDSIHTLNSNLRLGEITKYVRNQVMNICHATQVGFILYKDKSFEILQGSTAFFKAEKGRQFAQALLDNKELYHEAVFSSKLKEDERFNYRSIMVIPMHHGEGMYGFIAIMHKDRNYFTFDMFKLLQLLIRHSTLALANTILTEELEKAVITDYLTNLYSRSYLEKQIEEQKTGTLILFDIDDFKVVNDTYGHHVGDEVLKKTAEIIRSFAEAVDVAARWGGEELALYAPNISIDQGMQIAGLILRKVSEKTEPPITLSSGVSSWEHSKDDTVIDLFSRADKALYEAKDSGKNSVVKM